VVRFRPSWFHYVATSFVGLLLVAIGVLAYGKCQNWFTNLTYSMPVGIYRLRAADHVTRGSIVEVCESPRAARMSINREYVDHGDCWDGTEPLLKEVVAVPGDRVMVGADGERVNGAHLPWSEPRGLDSRGRPLKPLSGTFVIGVDQVWLYSPHPRSFDSRYYGAVDRSLIQGLAEPVLVAAMRRD
jgi:conjugative transfer signal peptidase TraF